MNFSAAIWGFLVGFVGWGACFRLIGPIAGWLLERRDNSVWAALTWCIVSFYIVFSVMSQLILLPLMLHVSGSLATGDMEAWRRVLGVSFLSSVAGFFVLGVFQTMQRRSSRPPDGS
jgi:hypothetical protein